MKRIDYVKWVFISLSGKGKALFRVSVAALAGAAVLTASGCKKREISQEDAMACLAFAELLIDARVRTGRPVPEFEQRLPSIRMRAQKRLLGVLITPRGGASYAVAKNQMLGWMQDIGRQTVIAHKNGQKSPMRPAFDKMITDCDSELR